jgi:hypothetical protein
MHDGRHGSQVIALTSWAVSERVTGLATGHPHGLFDGDERFATHPIAITECANAMPRPEAGQSVQAMIHDQPC